MPDSPHTASMTKQHQPERPRLPAMRHGWRGKCPNCGAGPLLISYLKVSHDCTVCGEELFHQRADDGPAYLTILIVGKIMVSTLYLAFVTWRPDPLTLFAIFAVGSTALSLYLLPRFKGAMIGYQWAKKMGGFDQPH